MADRNNKKKKNHSVYFILYSSSRHFLPENLFVVRTYNTTYIFFIYIYILLLNDKKPERLTWSLRTHTGHDEYLMDWRGRSGRWRRGGDTSKFKTLFSSGVDGGGSVETAVGWRRRTTGRPAVTATSRVATVAIDGTPRGPPVIRVTPSFYVVVVSASAWTWIVRLVNRLLVGYCRTFVPAISLR